MQRYDIFDAVGLRGLGGTESANTEPAAAENVTIPILVVLIGFAEVPCTTSSFRRIECSIDLVTENSLLVLIGYLDAFAEEE